VDGNAGRPRPARRPPLRDRPHGRLRDAEARRDPDREDRHRRQAGDRHAARDRLAGAGAPGRMTETPHPGRMRVRYRVVEDDPGLRRTLDAVLERVLERSLEQALARAGVPDDEEICVRSLRVDVRMRLDRGEASAADAWGAALAEAIAAALAAGPGPNVV